MRHRTWLAITVLALACAACGGNGGGSVQSYVKGHWPTFGDAARASDDSAVAVSWPSGRFGGECDPSVRVSGNYACFYTDASGRSGYVCVTDAGAPNPPWEITTAMGPGDSRSFLQADGSTSSPEQVC